MSVVLAVRGAGVTFLAADSATDSPDQRFITRDKVWQPRPWLGLGAVGDAATCARVKLATRSSMDTVEPPLPDEEADSWFWTLYSEKISELVYVPDRGTPEWESYAGFGMLVCVCDQILVVEQDGTPFVEDRGMVALGSGAGYALGDLPYDVSQLDNDLLRAYVVKAVKKAIEYCPSVGGEVRLLEVAHG